MISKKRIKGFLHYRTNLGDGVRTGVVFSDCSEHCSEVCSSFHFLEEHDFCEDTAEQSEYSSEELVGYLKEEKALYYSREIGITFLGKEPLHDPFFCADVARGLKECGIGLQVYTCGMCSMSAFDVLDGLVQLYVLRVFLPMFDGNSSVVFNQSERLQRIVELFEKRGTSYRFLLIFSSGSVQEAEKFAEFSEGLKYLKSIMLDFSPLKISEEDEKVFRSVFLKRKIPLY